MKLRETVIATAVLLSAGSVHGQDLVEDIVGPEPISPAIEEAVSRIDPTLIDWIQEIDLDLNGESEVLLRLKTPLDPAFPEHLEWRVLDEQDGVAVEIMSWLAQDVQGLTTQTYNLDPDEEPGMTNVIYSDGSYWLMRNKRMLPFGSITQRALPRAYTPSDADMEHFGVFDLEDLNRNYAEAVKIDFSELPGDERVVSIVNSGFARDSDGASPYVILSSKGDLIQSGYSFLFPLVYALPDGGFQVIERVNFAYQISYFHEGTQDE